MTTPDYNKEVGKLIEPFIYDWTAAHGGSVSAEHGLGKTRFTFSCTAFYFPTLCDQLQSSIKYNASNTLLPL